MKLNSHSFLPLLCSIIFIFITTNLYAQVQFVSHTIIGGEYSAVEATAVYAIDVDGDGDIDVLSASNEDSKIAWYENLLIVGIDDNNQFSPPVQFKLHNNYPNPFNPTTKINYQNPEISFVTLKVYDVLGNEIVTLVNEEKPAGDYNAEFTTNNLELTSGIYFYQLKVGNYIETKKMILLK